MSNMNKDQANVRRQRYIEKPKLEHFDPAVHDPANPPKPKQRTDEQQAKQDKLIKKEIRTQDLDDPRSRSKSRRDRRKRIQKGMEDGKYMKTAAFNAIMEADANGDLDQISPFDRIGPDSTSMDGPVTHARMLRGEIPVRGSNPDQPYYLEPKKEQPGTGGLMDCEGLKLSLEANLEIEIELKASIRGDLTISLFA